MTVFVKIKHTETGAVGTCPERALPHWEERGYTKVSDETPTTEPLGTVAEYGTFDPNGEGVKAADVRAYLTGIDQSGAAGKAEYDRVVEAEEAGQNRSTAFPA